MQCPILTHEEDFCLHENCRYYDTDLQECVYDAIATKKREQEVSAPSADTAPEKVPEEVMESRAYSEQITRTHVLHQTDTVPKESVEGQSGEDTSPPTKMNAKEVWDRLKRYHETQGIPGYESLIESLIQVVHSTPGIHYLTPKETDFWRSKVNGIDRYLVWAETTCG